MGIVVDMDANQERLLRKTIKLEAQNKKLKAGYRDIGNTAQRAGRKAKKAFSTEGLARYAKLLTGAGGIAAGIALVNRGYATWVKNAREVAAVARKAGNEIIAFAALQAGGTKAAAVRAAGALGAEFGISDRGQAFNTVQALQSRLGTLGQGLAAARTVFAATQLGISVEDATELEVVGGGLGQAPGMTVARAFVAGQASAREPAVLARAARGLQFFPDQDVAFAAAATLAGLFGDETGTFLKAAGIGLGQTSADAFQKTLRGLGVGDASRLEKLTALERAGLDSPEKLALAGLTEQRQGQAIAVLVSNMAEFTRILREVVAKSDPSIFGVQRRAVEAELPVTRLAREIAVAESRFSDITGLGEPALPALIEERRARIRGLALRNMGIESAFGFDVIDEQGRTTPADFFLARAAQANPFGISRDMFQNLAHAAGQVGATDFLPTHGPGLLQSGKNFEAQFTETVLKYMDSMQKAAARLESAGEHIDSAASKLSSESTLGVVPGEDK